MKKLFICLIFSFTTYALKSPIPSSLIGIELPNAHQVDDEGLILRSMAPKGHYEEVLSLGIDKVLIFKKQTKKEVDQEIEDLQSYGYALEDIKHIPFPWHDFESEESACEMTIQGLNYLFDQKSLSQRTLVHCTVGEDRTGHLMGLFRILDSSWTVEKALKEEMCERGYGRGNKNKPQYVVGEVRSDLSPIFFKMATLLQKKYKANKPLKVSWCKGLKDIKVTIKKCRWSSVFEQ